MQRTKVFISYSRRDAYWLKRLQVHLRPLERAGVLDLWSDTRIPPGTHWREAIQQALDTTRVAVLLVSADFLASDFIAKHELPPLLHAAEREGATILPVIVAPCRLQHDPQLAPFQAVNDWNQPLKGLSEVEQEEMLVRVSEAIEDALTNPLKPALQSGIEAGQVSNVPLRRNRFFTGRTALFADVLREEANNGVGPDRSQTKLVQGIASLIQAIQTKKPSETGPSAQPPELKSASFVLFILVIIFGGAIGWDIGWHTENIGLAIGGAIVGVTGGAVIGYVLKWTEPFPSFQQLVMITLGWAIGGAISWDVGGAISGWESDNTWAWDIGWAIVGAIGGTVTGYVLKRTEPFLSFQQLVVITLGWAIGGYIGGYIGFEMEMVGYVGTVHWTIGWAIVGAIGGTVTGYVLKRTEPFLSFQQLVMITLGWAIGLAIGGYIVGYIQVYIGSADLMYAPRHPIGTTIYDALGRTFNAYSRIFDLYALGPEIFRAITDRAISWAIGLAIGGAIGGWIMFWCLRRIHTKKQRSVKT